jgi:predicted site-specific integrase-resolvase
MDGNIFVPLRKAVELTGLHPNTLRKYSDNGQIQSYKSLSGQRMFHQHSLQKYSNNVSYTPQISGISKENFIYARVSSRKQLDDLLRQIQFLQTRKHEYANFRVIQDVASGINFKRKGLQTILDACLQKTVGEIVVAHKDRLARFGYDLVEYLVENAGGKITVIDKDNNRTPDEELTEDLLSIIHVFSCKKMGRRSYKTNLQSHQDTTENKRGEKKVIPEMVKIQ